MLVSWDYRLDTRNTSFEFQCVTASISLQQSTSQKILRSLIHFSFYERHTASHRMVPIGSLLIWAQAKLLIERDTFSFSKTFVGDINPRDNLLKCVPTLTIRCKRTPTRA